MNGVSQVEKTGSCSFGLLNNGLHSVCLNLDHGCYLQEQVDTFRESNTDHFVQLGYIARGSGRTSVCLLSQDCECSALSFK